MGLTENTGYPDLDRLEALFQGALDLPPGQRGAFLDEHLGDESDLREELRTLLEHAATDPGFLDRMAHRVVAPASGQALSEIQPRRLDEDLEGRYRIEREIGRGGMATVYLAHDVRHRRRVALKVLDPRLATVLGPERFLAEIRTTASLQHSHILPLFDSGEAAGSLFYVMPYVEGESLRARLDRETQLPVEEAVRIASEVAEALDHAHRQGVIHRDIKPGNILLREGRALVADFGIARATTEAAGERLTETGLSLGTPYYMSPEQATGGKELGPTSDIYALGCVLYEMLAGEPPHTGNTTQAVIGRILSGEVRPLRADRPTVPPNVEAAVARALERLPADRFRSARGFRRALSDPGFRHGSGEEVGVPAARSRLSPWAVGVGLAAGLVVGLSLSLLRAPPEGALLPLRHTSILLPPGTIHSPSERRAPLAISPDGTRIVFAAREEDGEAHQLWSRLLIEGEPVPVPGGSGAGSIFLSPDGRFVGFNHRADGALRRIPISGGEPVTIAMTGLGPAAPRGAGFAGFLGGAWGPDGTIVFAVPSGLRRVRATGGSPIPMTTLDADGNVLHRQPTFLPDGSGVVFTIAPRDFSEFPERQRIAALRFDGTIDTLTTGHSPAVTADRILVFSRGGTGELWAARLSDDGSRLTGPPVRVLDSGPAFTGDARYAVADEGTLIYQARRSEAGSFALQWVDRSGRGQTIVDMSQYPRLQGGVAGGRLSPDGTRVAFRARFGEPPRFRIFVYDLAGRSLTPISIETDADWPVWTADGEYLVFNRFTSEEHELYRIRADGSGPAEPLIPPNPYQQHAQQFTGDGRHLVITHREYTRAPNSDIGVLSMENGEYRPVVAERSIEAHARLSPDDRWLAYASDESGESHIYVTDFPEGRNRWHVSAEPAFCPVWNPSGTELLYRRWGGPVNEVISVPVSPDTTFHHGTPEILFDESFFGGVVFGCAMDVAPDGERFLMSPWDEAETRSPRIDVVTNWLPEVRRRLGGAGR